MEAARGLFQHRLELTKSKGPSAIEILRKEKHFQMKLEKKKKEKELEELEDQ